MAACPLDIVGKKTFRVVPAFNAPSTGGRTAPSPAPEGFLPLFVPEIWRRVKCGRLIG
jgi:hypothetical protein